MKKLTSIDKYDRLTLQIISLSDQFSFIVQQVFLSNSAFAH